MNSRKLLSENPLRKSTPTPPEKFENCKSPLFANIEIFLGPHCRKWERRREGGGGWGWRSVYGTGRKFSSNPVNSKSINQSKICLQMFDWVLNTYTSEFDNKDSRTTSFMLFLCFYCWLWIIFVHWFSCIFDMSHKFIFHCFGQVNNIWERF